MLSDALQENVKQWYMQDPSREAVVKKIIEGKAGISLREIDHFVTNMCARDKVMYYNDKSDKVINVHSEYKDILRCYHKCNFDTFKRRTDKPGSAPELKQKLFFRWALENGIVDYVTKHTNQITQDMISFKYKNKKEKTVKKSKVAVVIKPSEVKIPYRSAIKFNK